MQALIHGLGFHDVLLFLARFLLGFFFVSYRFRWIWDPASNPHFCNTTRQDKLRQKLCHCGWPPGLAPAVALGEIAAGLGVIFGVLTVISAIGLLLILIVATICTAKEKTMRQNPIDGIDVVNCYLWNPEPVYITLALLIIGFGGGVISVDALAIWLLS
jgi:uncharacterized membrane protein YphA (DoxX/SURF4 family)